MLEGCSLVWVWVWKKSALWAADAGRGHKRECQEVAWIQLHG